MTAKKTDPNEKPLDAIPTMKDVPIDEQIACVKREIAMRQRVYPKWIQSGKMTLITAMTEQERMAAVLRTLEVMKGASQLSLLLELLAACKLAAIQMEPGVARADVCIAIAKVESKLGV